MVGIRRFKLLACLEQLRSFVSCFFDLAKYFVRAFPRAQDEYNEDVVCGSDLIVGVHKVTHELLGVKPTRQSGTRIGPDNNTRWKLVSSERLTSGIFLLTRAKIRPQWAHLSEFLCNLRLFQSRSFRRNARSEILV